MSTVIESIPQSEPHLVEADEMFHAPAVTDTVSLLLAQYNDLRRRIEAMSQAVCAPENAGCLGYFLEGNIERSSRLSMIARELFAIDGAIKSLNAAFWSKALALTDVLDLMPQARRSEWHNAIRELKTPDFTEEAVRPTIADLLCKRQQFFAERIDGIFRGLSGNHVTNSPAGFGKRMIISRVLDANHYGNESKIGLISDLRCVIARFMGRAEPKHYMTLRIVEDLKRNWGQWVELDGGALRVRVYKVGTGHIEVHPDIAWRLNQVLASLYPQAIPAEFRREPSRKVKTYATLQRPLPFEVLDLLSAAADATRNGRQTAYLSSSGADCNSTSWAEACRVLESLGGAQIARGHFQFDYPPYEVLRSVILSGCVPDQKAYQFYPTQETLAEQVEEELEIQDDDTVLEPSAGQGGLACRLPKEQTTCVELSAMNCQVLRSKGFNVIEGDFLQWSEQAFLEGKRFSKVGMNPPFSEGRAIAHLEAAARLVSPNGRLVAILPGSMHNTDPLPRFKTRWSSPIDGAFAGTGVTVTILVADRVA